MTTAIAVTLYNGERFILAQMESLRLQTRPADHVVFCDDGSKDATCQIVRDYISAHGLSHWQLYENPENLGYARNFYRAISLCNGDLVYLCDQDDIWKPDKLEKMTAVMDSNPQICLLSCRYDIIDADGQTQTSMVEEAACTDEKVHPITVQDIMRAYRWPGMLMCLRKAWFLRLQEKISASKVAHDLVFSLCAAEIDGFWEYNYIGASHRRHDNNTAREEHRVSKLLNLQRKLTDIAVTKKHWNGLLDPGIPIKEETRCEISHRLQLLNEREAALKNKDLAAVLRLYRRDKGKYLRKKSLVCDVWLAMFGKRMQ